MTFIGDVHDKIERYNEIISNCEYSICVGDFGFKKEWDWYIENVYNKIGGHFINPGNHDYGPYMSKQENGCTGDYLYFPTWNIFTVRGADSIDKHLRIEGVDWFSNEELNYAEQLAAFDHYVQCRPKIVVTHDCPQSVMEKLFGYSDKSQTRQMLQAMFDEHQPDIWIFGHHHKSKDVQINGTRFVCLAELETMTIEI